MQEAGGLRIKASLGYIMRPCLKKKKKGAKSLLSTKGLLFSVLSFAHAE
jgi:hypothetical protein